MKRYEFVLIGWLMILVLIPGASSSSDYTIGSGLSLLKQTENSVVVCKDSGVEKPGLDIFKDHGYNWIRLRLCHTPTRLPNDLDDLIIVAKAAKKHGFKFLLNGYDSGTWTGPRKQFFPKAWEEKSKRNLSSRSLNIRGIRL